MLSVDLKTPCVWLASLRTWIQGVMRLAHLLGLFSDVRVQTCLTHIAWHCDMHSHAN